MEEARKGEADASAEKPIPPPVQVQTQGGAYSSGEINTGGGDFVGRDKITININLQADAASIIQQVFEYWQKFNETADAQLDQVLLAAYQSSTQATREETIKEQLIGAIRAAHQKDPQAVATAFQRAGSQERRFLWDERIADIAPQIRPAAYRWPEIYPPISSELQDAIVRWIELAELSCYPFAPANKLACNPLSFELAVLPTPLQPYFSSKETALFYSPESQDVDLTVLALQKGLCQASLFPTPSFVVMLSPEAGALSAGELLDQIVRAVGWAWLKFLALNPDVFLALDGRRQFDLAYLLVWCTQLTGQDRWEALKFELLRAGASVPGEVGPLMDRMREALGSPTFIAPPDRAQKERWLSLRPPGVEHTHLLVRFQPGLAWDVYNHLILSTLEIQEGLLESHVIAKIFCPHRVRFFQIPVISIRWPAEELKEQLNRRISVASTKPGSLPVYFDFNSLFNPGVQAEIAAGAIAPDEILCRKANGSLARLLVLADRALRYHAERSPRQKELDWSDLEILDQEE